IVCNATVDADCTWDGRVFDNATAVRITLSTQPDGRRTLSDPFPLPAGTDAIHLIGPPVIASAPAVVSHNVDTYDVFFVTTDGHLHTVSQDNTGTWGPEQDAFPSLPGSALTGAVAATAPDRTTTQLFLTTVQGEVLQGQWNPAAGYIQVY